MTSSAAAPTPRVTVLLPAYNAARHLRDALESLLGQTFAEFELVVVNDGSTDSTVEILRSCSDPRIRVVENPANLGLAASLNRGLSIARAELVARMDADDVAHPRRLERQVAHLDAHLDVALLGTQAWLIDERGACRGEIAHGRGHDAIRWELLLDNAFLHTSVMFRRGVVQELGGYDESFHYGEDFDLWSRLVHSGRWRASNLGERLVESRLHGASMTETMLEANGIANRRVIPRNFRALFGSAPTPGECDLLLGFRLGLDEAGLAGFLALFARLLAEHRRRNPEVARSADFRATVARQYASLAFMKANRSFGRASRVLWAGVSESPVLSQAVRALALRLQIALGADPRSPRSAPVGRSRATSAPETGRSR